LAYLRKSYADTVDSEANPIYRIGGKTKNKKQKTKNKKQKRRSTRRCVK
jgi:hypothetical protein